jgi:homoserine O-acetyltransferase
MVEIFKTSSVGIVKPQVAKFEDPLNLECGFTLDSFELVYETYGRLNKNRSNAVLVCHALSGNHHAAGFHSENDDRAGWWDEYIGPGKPIDTEKFYVVSLNNLGGCHGSTGPCSENPTTLKPWGNSFPSIRVKDWVESQVRLADRLEINSWAAVIGGSLGGMQVMQWAIDHPLRIRNAVVIASALKLSAQNIAFNEIARQAIQADPKFADGNYLSMKTIPEQGLALARMIGHVTYLSDDAMALKFGRELRSGSFDANFSGGIEFQVESYLKYQGKRFSGQFDANSYILMTRALDFFDLARNYNDNAVAAFSVAECKFLVVSFTTDWRFSPSRSHEIVEALIAAKKNVTYVAIKADEGHDAFLLPIPRYFQTISAYMKGIDTS